MEVFDTQFDRRFRWAVASDREIDGDWIWFSTQCKPKKYIYEPSEHRELPNQLAQIARADAGLTAFVTTYGRLGWRELCERRVGTDGHWWKQSRKKQRRLKDMRAADGRVLPTQLAEPIAWIEAHAATVRWCLDAAHALTIVDKRDRHQRCAELMPTRPKPIAVGAGLVPRFDFLEKRVSAFSAVNNVGFFLSSYLDHNLRGVSWRFWYDGELYGEVRGGTLLEAIYRQVAQAATGGRLVRCESVDCGAIFLQTDERQRFCPPRAGHEKSSCMNRERVRRFRQKRQASQRQEGGGR